MISFDYHFLFKRAKLTQKTSFIAKIYYDIQPVVKIKGAKWLLLKNKKDLKEEELQKLELVLKQSERLRKAHEYKESFREIYEKVNDKEEGRLKFTEWLNKAKEVYIDVIGTIRRHLDSICNYFISRTTSGVMEGINNRLKLIKRQAYGLALVQSNCCAKNLT